MLQVTNLYKYLVTFNDEIIHGKLYLLYSEMYLLLHFTCPWPGPFLVSGISFPVFGLTHQHSPVEPWHCLSAYNPSLTLHFGTKLPTIRTSLDDAFISSCWQLPETKTFHFLAGKCMLKVRSKSTRWICWRLCWICPKLTLNRLKNVKLLGSYIFYCTKHKDFY